MESVRSTREPATIPGKERGTMKVISEGGLSGRGPPEHGGRSMRDNQLRISALAGKAVTRSPESGDGPSFRGAERMQQPRDRSMRRTHKAGIACPGYEVGGLEKVFRSLSPLAVEGSGPPRRSGSAPGVQSEVCPQARKSSEWCFYVF